MRILHIINSLNHGGAEGMMTRLATQQNKSKNNKILIITIFETQHKSLINKLDYEGIVTYSLGCTSIWQVFFKFFKLVNKIKSFNPKVIQTWLYYSDFFGGIASKLAGYQDIFWNLRNSSLDEGNKLFKVTSLFLLGFASNFVPKKIISCSFASNKFHRRYLYNSKKFVLIPNGYIVPLHGSEKIFSSKLKIGSIGRFNYLKDHLTLFRALKIIENKGVEYELILAGQGMNKSNKNLINLIKDSKINVGNIRFYDHVENMKKVYEELDTICISSLAEGFPNVAVEAMLNKVNVISTDAGDIEYILGNKNFVVDIKEHAQLATKIIYFNNLSLKEKNEIITKNFERASNKFGIKNIEMMYNNAYQIKTYS